MNRKRIRVYPPSCTSAFCGRTECPADCRHFPRLIAFKRWVKETGAKVEDPIWCPTAYVAEVHDEEA